MATTKAVRGRTRNEILSDALIALHAPVSDGFKWIVADNLCWAWTDVNGKYVGCPFWTATAVDLYKSNRTQRDRRPVKNLRHEHAVPRSIVRERLLADPPTSRRSLLRLCRRLLFAVVVTREEAFSLDAVHKADMPDGYASGPLRGNPWSRFREAGLLADIVVRDSVESPSRFVIRALDAAVDGIRQ